MEGISAYLWWRIMSLGSSVELERVLRIQPWKLRRRPRQVHCIEFSISRANVVWWRDDSPSESFGTVREQIASALGGELWVHIYDYSYNIRIDRRSIIREVYPQIIKRRSERLSAVDYRDESMPHIGMEAWETERSEKKRGSRDQARIQWIVMAGAFMNIDHQRQEYKDLANLKGQLDHEKAS